MYLENVVRDRGGFFKCRFLGMFVIVNDGFICESVDLYFFFKVLG